MLSLHFGLLLLAALAPLSASEQVPIQTSSSKFPWIRKFASIGDSYSAGLGSGKRIDFKCSRYAESYPNFLHRSLLGEDTDRTHQFLSCSGADSDLIFKYQVPYLQEDIDLLTISAGGNDIGLTPILNNCIYQFYMAGEADCEQSITDAQKRIADKTQLYHNVSAIIEATQHNMNPEHGVIYVTGYAGFFGTDDVVCDNVTWAVWNSIESSKQYLTLDMRKRLNDLVRSVNLVLRKATEDAGPNVRFIDYNSHIEAIRGRYCESGIVEPEPNRPSLSFYEWNTVDNGENGTALQNETGGDVPKGSFEGGIGELINKTLREHPDWEFDPDKGFVNKTKGGVEDEGIIEDTIHWLLPDAWKRVFHLRPAGHKIVASLLVEDLYRRGPGRRKEEVEEL